MKNNVSQSELKLAIDLIRVCDLSSEVLAITEARWPIDEVQIFPTQQLELPRLHGKVWKLSTTSS